MYYLCHFFARYTVNEITSDSTNTFSLFHTILPPNAGENIIQTVPRRVSDSWISIQHIVSYYN